MINYDVLKDEENVNEPTAVENAVTPESITENPTVEETIPEDTVTEETTPEEPQTESHPIKEVDNFLGNNKLGYNIWDTIVKGV